MDNTGVERLQEFRQKVHDLCSHRADALCDVIDGALSAGLVPSFAYLSLQAAHQRGHGSLYAALAKGRLDIDSARRVIVSTLPDIGQPVYAIDTSTYIRSDAETSPERGVYYHASRHSAGKPVVAGWSYSWCAQLGDYSSSWTAPVDVSRVPIELDAHEIAGKQMHAVRATLPSGITPLFAFDAGYDPTRLAEQIAKEEGAILVRLRRNRCFYADPLEEQRAVVGRPSTHGAKFVCNDPTTWPTPDLSMAKPMKAMGMYGLGIGATFMRERRTIPDAAPARPSLLSEERSFSSKSPSYPGRPASLEPSGCGGGVLVCSTSPFSGGLMLGALISSIPLGFLKLP